ncbi:prenyltransferase [Schleiferia thermophila]|jgi:4-hydroxybenzoate polyprenyltransferase|nr:prenyltransferase [Schleiferia thermophila]
MPHLVKNLARFLMFVRWQNLALAAFIQLFLRYGFVIPFGMTPALSHFQFALGIIATILLMAAGYIVNDIFDLEADKINKPERTFINKFISEKYAWNLYFVFTIFALIISLYLSLIINRINYFSIPVLTALLLYLYATDLKRKALIGNFIIALLAGLSIITVLLFDIMPVITSHKHSSALKYFILIVHIFIAFFAFLTTLIRELIKTLEDCKGDHSAGYSTAPIQFGEQITLHIVRILMVLLASITLYAAYMVKSVYLYIYISCLLILPWAYIFYLLFQNSSNKYSKSQKWMKVTMLFGILSLFIIQI